MICTRRQSHLNRLFEKPISIGMNSVIIILHFHAHISTNDDASKLMKDQFCEKKNIFVWIRNCMKVLQFYLSNKISKSIEI